MHPSDDILLAWLDGELDAPETHRVQQHVESCASCAGKARDISSRDQSLLALFSELDRRVPRISADDLMGRRRRRGIPWAIAAAMGGLFLAGGVAALTSPGFRAAVSSVFQFDEPEAEQIAPELSPRGIELASPPELEVILPDTPFLGVLEFRMSQDGLVRLESDADSVRFEVRQAQLLVTQAMSGADFVLTVPRDLIVLTVRVGDREVLRKRGEVTVPPVGTSGAFVIPLAPGASTPSPPPR